MKPDVVILCGGLGRRLGRLTRETPKSLLEVGKVPFLYHLLTALFREGFQRVVLATHYLADHFEAFAERYRDPFPGIQIVKERTPLGTGGALRFAAASVRTETLVVLNGDSYISQSILPVLQFHQEGKSVFTLVAVPTRNVEGQKEDKGGVRIDKDHRVVSFSGHSLENKKWVNAGLYVCQKNKILGWPERKYNLEEKLASLLHPDKARAFLSEGHLIDIGVPHSLELARLKSFSEGMAT